MTRIVKKPEERRREIIAASRQLFLEKDYEKATMQDVMFKLQIAKGTTYHYFKSKAELLEAVVEDIVNEYLADVEKALEKSKGKALVKMRALFSASKVKGSLAKTMEALHRPGNVGMHTRLLAVTILRLAPLYALVISQGCQEGIFQTEYPLESAELLLAGIQFLTDQGCYPWGSEDLKRRSAAIPALIETQLHASKGSFNFILQL